MDRKTDEVSVDQFSFKKEKGTRDSILPLRDHRKYNGKWKKK